MAEVRNQRQGYLPEQDPVLEAQAGSDKSEKGKTSVREMEMGVTVRKGEKPEIHKYIREDR
jgi:hypothetical protein